MHKLFILALVTGACALDSNTSSIESQSSCDKDCEPPPPPNGPTCTIRGEVVDLDSQEANVDSNDSRVTFCHHTGSEKNPYILLTTDVEGCNGHANPNHEPGGDGDIFPSQGCAD